MPETNVTESARIGYTGYGTSIAWDSRTGKPYTIPSPPDIGSYVWTASKLHVESVNSVGYYVKKKVLVQYVTKNPSGNMKEPTPPRLYLRDLPVLKPRRPNQSVSSFAKALIRFERLHRDALFARKEALRRFEERSIVYHRRLAAFRRQQLLIKNGVLRYKRIRTGVHLNSFNPYLKTYEKWFPTTGLRTQHQRSSYAGSVAYGAVVYSGLPAVSQGNAFWTGSTPEELECYQSALSAAESRAIAKIYDKIAGQQVHVANIIAERHQTLDLLTNSFKTMTKMVIGMKRKLLSVNTVRAIADITLATLFGVKPLIEDITGAVKILRDGTALRAAWLTFRSRQIASNQCARTVIVVREGGKNNIKHTIVTKISVKVSYHLEYEVDDAMSATLETFGFINPAEVAWELMPWSFVVDWFLPIGGWISSLTASTGLRFLRGVRVQTTKRLITIQTEYLGKDTKGSDYQRFWETGMVVTMKQDFRKERFVLDKAPSPRLPPVKWNPFTQTHCAEAASLLTQVLTGGSRSYR